MNWKEALFKPKWRAKDPAVRRAAVAFDRDARLLAALPDILRDDDDGEVRAAAARRIDEPRLLLDALKTESDATARRAIADRLRQLAASVGEERPSLADREQIVQSSDDRDLLEAVALNAPEAELRKAAIGRIDRQGFLGDRAIEDPDPGIRRFAAGAITQHSTLKRVIDGTRTSDKALHQDLAERLHRERLASGDEEAIRREALSLCERLERSLARGDPAAGEIEAVTAAWAAVADRAPSRLARRFEHDLQRLQSPAAPQEDDPGAPPADSEVGEQPPPGDGEAASAPAAEAPADARLVEALESIRSAAAQAKGPPTPRRLNTLEKNWSQAWSAAGGRRAEDARLKQEAENLLGSLAAAAEQATAQRDAAIEQAKEISQALQQALDEGELHRALELRARLQGIGKELGGGRRWKSVQKQLNNTLGRLRELRDWQHWANDKIRKRLIREMEALPGAGLHPDAVLDRIKTLQAEWKDLEAKEQIPGDRHYASAPWMWRRFSAAGRKAFELTKPFLDKRSEVQAKRLEDMRAQAKELTALATSADPDFKALRDAMGRARKALRSLSTVPPKSRQRMARELKAALEAGNTARQAHFAEIEKKKLKLIREAAQLPHVADRDDAIQQAKALQAAWQAAGSLWRGRENELWEQFRAPLDPLFEELEAERESVRERDAARRAEQSDLCEQMAQIVGLPDEQLSGQHGRVQGLAEKWQDYRHPDRGLQVKFETLLQRYHDRERALRRAARQSQRKRWWTKAELVHEAETAARSGSLDEKTRATLRESWPPEEPDAAGPEPGLERRFRAAMAGEQVAADGEAESVEPDQDPVEEARKICIFLEFLAGLPPPEDERELRMQYQVERLSASMSGERERLSAREEARQLERQWLGHPYLPEPEYGAFSARVKAALSAILEG